MSTISDKFEIANDLLLGKQENRRVSVEEQKRQRCEAVEILRRFRRQPGVILADEVGMGKTFVALSVAYSAAVSNITGPVVVLVPKNLIDKWCRDLDAFCDLYLPHRKVMCCRGDVSAKELILPNVIRYGIARNSVEYLKLLDDKRAIRAHFIFLAHGAMSRGLNDEWVKLALIRETLQRYGRKRRLNKVKKQALRYLVWVA